VRLDKVTFGMRDIYIAEANAPFENPQIVNQTGSGKVTVTPLPLGDPDNAEGKPNRLKLAVEAGTVGETNKFGLQIDGHVGEGEAPVLVELEYETVAPDATTLQVFTRLRSEPI